MDSAELPINENEKIEQETAVSFVTHFYQPPRELQINLHPWGISHQAGFSVYPEINRQICNQVYQPLLGAQEENSPPLFLPGWTMSCYASLRSYFKLQQPELWQNFINRIQQTPNREYVLLADPWLHVILPLLPETDQNMLIALGKEAFRDDLGFDSAGFWLPEAAVSHRTLWLLKHQGYQLVALNNNQLVLPEKERQGHNFGWLDNMGVLIGNSQLGRELSYGSLTSNGDDYLQRLQKSAKNRVALTDGELYGHHHPFADMFLKYTLRSVRPHHLVPLNVPLRMKTSSIQLTLLENSSWSCPHSLGRWTGSCSCGENGPPSQDIIAERQRLYHDLSHNNNLISSALDLTCPNWRHYFVSLVLPLRDLIFTGQSFVADFLVHGEKLGLSKQQQLLMLAKLETLIGFTSCGWFFGKSDSKEVEIPQNMLRAGNELLAIVNRI